MATTNADRVGNALRLLAEGLAPFVERELAPKYDGSSEEWYVAAAARPGRPSPRPDEVNTRDVSFLLGCLKGYWDPIFSRILSRSDRSLVFELSDHRNRWAHQESFSTDDTYRALDSAERLLKAISAPEAREVEKEKAELMRRKFAAEARAEKRKQAAIAVEGQPAAGLSPWREIVTPHRDVASGRYQQAEFAADLAQVARGDAASEYGDPREFFRRTFITDGLHKMLKNAALRLHGEGGDPVVDLQTNFGGGKTHSLLALYHLVSGASPQELTGVEDILTEAGIKDLPEAKRAVIVGTDVSPAQPRQTPDGVELRTLWGELAYQLGGRDGYEQVAQADATGTAPGSGVLKKLFESVGPSLILIDEWVAYARQLYGKDGLAAGSFDAHFSFAQSLTEAAKQCKNVLLVVSIPASDIEIGGEGGQKALERLTNVVKRMESPWSPATADEGFEIVRRRLFDDITDPELFRKRDAVIKAFGEMYRSHKNEFPSEAAEAEYERRMEAAYPIHPYLFDVLYNEWSTLDRFQRTRGVLRLMASVIHEMWERDDKSLLIMPSGIPMDALAVQDELTHYVERVWVPIIQSDVDGPNSLPLKVDRDNPALGRYSSTRRVARTIYLGSAPTHQATNRGIGDQTIKLGCVQPGEAPATFGDALRRLSDQSTYLYVDGQRFWYSTTPTVTKLAKDRAAQQKLDMVHLEIVNRVRADTQRGQFAAKHVAPESTSDVPDEAEARLVVLHPEHPHDSKSEDSEGLAWAKEILDYRGNSPRSYRNMLVFLAPDAKRLEELEDAVREYMAWTSILAEEEALNLDAFQRNQAKTKEAQADDTVTHRILETYQWTLVPSVPREDPTGEVHWETIRVSGIDNPAERVAKKLSTEESLITEFAGVRLAMELNRVPLWRGDDVTVKQLWEDFATYLYLPRLRDSSVLARAVQDGLSKITWEQDTFAYADSYDQDEGRYRGLTAGQQVNAVALDGVAVLLKPDVAAELKGKYDGDQEGLGPEAGSAGGSEILTDPPPDGPDDSPAADVGPKRFFGTTTVSAERFSRDVQQIAENVIVHLQSQMGTELRIRIDIEAEIPDGAPDKIVRTVTENAGTLGFEAFGFEAE